MATLKTTNIQNAPSQKLSMRNKTQKWREASVDYYIAKSVYGTGNDINRKQQMKIAYDLYNSTFDEADFKYITDPYKVSEGFPASLQNFNIIKPKIDLLEGEESKRPFPFKVVQTDEGITTDVQKMYKQLLFEEIVAINEGGDPNMPVTDEEMQRLEAVNEYMYKDYSAIAETQAYHTLKYLNEKEDMKTKYLVNFHDFLCSNSLVGFVGQINGEPVYERVNPLYFSCDSTPENGHIEDGDWAVRKMRMTKGSIQDRFYDMLEEKDLNRLEEMFNPSGNNAVVGESTNGISWKSGPDFADNNARLTDETVDVYHVAWRSLKKVGFLHYTDEAGEDQVDVVDETYKPLEDEVIEWDWICEIWEGYRIGKDMYLGVHPLPSQTVSLDNPNKVSLPYVGTTFEYKNTDSKSLVEIMKPLQYLYIAVMYQVQLAIARDKGKIISVDITQIPKSMGMDANKWLHFLSSTNVNFYNPYECFAPGTKVMMANGRIKNIEDIVIGDQVMGPDGEPKNVLHTHAGQDRMYRLKHRSGAKDQIVNSAHKNYYVEKDYYTGEWKECLKSAIELLDENQEKPYKSKLRYTKRSQYVDCNWHSDLRLDPYLLGLWLGDGSKGRAEIHSIDPEIISWLDGYSKDNDLEISITQESVKSDVSTIRLFKGAGINNPIKSTLNSYGILNNKDIPEDYIYSNRKDRLKLLAGLIDTDGSYSIRDRIYTFSQSEDRKHIVEKAAFIARSLGFKVSVNKYGESHEKYIADSDNISTCQATYVMSILDWDIEIPTLIERKKAKCPDKKGSRTLSHFEVEYEGIGDFHGIHIDGDHLFLLDDFTVVHNTGWDTPGREGGKPAQSSTFSAADLSMSQTIVQYIQLLSKIEDMIGELSGVSRQRQGQVQSSELVGNVQQTIVQSSHITEYLFYTMTQFKKRVYTQLLDTAKTVWRNSDKKKLHYITDDAIRMFMDMTDEFLYSDMSIFVSDSTKEHQNVEALRALAQPAMQNGASISEVAELYVTDNLTDMRSKFKKIEESRQRREDEMAQQQQQAQQAATEAQMQIAQQQQAMEQAKLQAEMDKEMLKADTSIQVAHIQAGSKQYTDDTKVDVEQMKADLQLMLSDDKTQIENSKLQQDTDKFSKDLKVKEKDLNETVRSNKATEQIQRVAANKPAPKSN